MKWLLYALIFIISYFSFNYFQFGNISIFIIFLILFSSLLIQLLLHEFGHLIFGLMTGYTFISFRIFFFLFIKSGNKIKCIFLPDNAFWGQCLMAPPSKDRDGKFPYFFYNAGGIINNIIFSLPAFIPVLITTGITQFFFFSLSFSGLILATLNAFPANEKIPNDGHNLASMRANKDARDAYYIQLYVNGKIFQGAGYSQLDRNLITLSPYAKIDCPLIVTAKFIEYYHYCHSLDFEQALLLITNLAIVKDILQYHRDLIILEQIFITIINGNLERAQLLVQRLPSNVRAALLASHDIDKKRILFAISAFLENNEQATEKLYQDCLRASHSFYLKGVAQDELHLVKILYEKYMLQKTTSSNLIKPV